MYARQAVVVGVYRNVIQGCGNIGDGRQNSSTRPRVQISLKECSSLISFQR